MYVPVVAVAAGTAEASGTQLKPLSALKSMSNICAAPSVWVQVIARDDPAAHVTAVFRRGDSYRGCDPEIRVADVLNDPFAVHLIRTRPAVVAGPMTVQGNVPDVFAVFTPVRRER